MRNLIIAIMIIVSTSGLTQTFENPVNRPTASMQWYKGKDNAKCINGSKTQIEKLFQSMHTVLDLGEPVMVHGNTKTYKARKDGFEYRIMYFVTDSESSIVVNREAVLYYEND